MKARIKETGEIIDVIEWSHSVVNPRVYSITFLSNGNYVKIDNADEFEILPDEPDWNQIKIQASISAMQGIIQYGIPNGIGVSKQDYAAHWAIEYAESLITELKKQTK